MVKAFRRSDFVQHSWCEPLKNQNHPSHGRSPEKLLSDSIVFTHALTSVCKLLPKNLAGLGRARQHTVRSAGAWSRSRRRSLGSNQKDAIDVYAAPSLSLALSLEPQPPQSGLQIYVRKSEGAEPIPLCIGCQKPWDKHGLGSKAQQKA